MTDSAGTLVIGEALIDVVREQTGQVREYPGGSPMNVAIGLARLGHPVQLATWIGTDERGDRIAAHLAADGVALSPGSTGAERTATATATIDESGSAQYEFDLSGDLPSLQVEAGHVHIGSIAAILPPGSDQILKALRASRAGITVSYDPNARPALMGDPAQARASVEERIAVSDVVKASDEDIAWFYDGADLDNVLLRWLELGAAVAIATRGGDGALLRLRGHEQALDIPGLSTEVADTVGAGDSFMAGLLSALWDLGLLGSADARANLHAAQEDTVHSAADRAIRASAITVSRPGADPPTRADLGL
ncbi:carbohydrate kinase family protein [Dermacoccaceae bacterium W4C1]